MVNTPVDMSRDLIYAYTRAQAIDDGVLVDVSETAREAGFQWPVALTRAVWDMIEEIPARFQNIQDVQGRLWDVVWMGALTARRSAMQVRRRGATAVEQYRVILHYGRRTYQTLKMVCGPGDDGAAVITIMLPDED